MRLANNIKKEEWNKFVGSQNQGQFLQSWEWSEFQAMQGSDIKRLAVMENDEIIAVATLIKKKLPVGKNYWLCPRGPVIEFRISNFEFRIRILKFLFEEIRKNSKKDNIIFLRFEPTFGIRHSTFKIVKTIDIQPPKSLIFDLAKSEEELLSAMHQKTRYNIRLAEKKGVKIRPADKDDFGPFWKLMSETKTRDNFRLHHRDHYELMAEFNKDFIKLFLAEYNNKIIAGGIFSFFGDTATYIHGASSNICREVMAPHLLQWHIIKCAKDKGLKYYDFFGIDEGKWPGVTRFKKGFGGQEVEYPGTYDIVFCGMWYNIYKIARRVRRI